VDKPKDFVQEKERNEYRYIEPKWLDELAKGLTKGAEKYPGETWRQIPAQEHLARAMRHINLYRAGDRNENHLVNASMRLMMAFTTAESDARKGVKVNNAYIVVKRLKDTIELHRYYRDGESYSAIVEVDKYRRKRRELAACKTEREGEMLAIFEDKVGD